jgi:hypothetical protein
MCSFNCRRVRVCLHTFWVSSVPRRSSQAQGGQETWLARQCHQNVQRCIRETWLSNTPLIHVLCKLWHRLAKTRAHYRRPALPSIVLRLLSLYSYAFYMPGRPLRRYKHTLNGMLLLILNYFCVSYILPHSTQQRSENCHIVSTTGTVCIYTRANTENVRMCTKSYATSL